MDTENTFFNEHGQSLIIVALIMVALIAMLAFALDGGNTYFQRRNAQNAADAAAIAGANAYCKELNILGRVFRRQYLCGYLERFHPGGFFRRDDAHPSDQRHDHQNL